MPNVVDALVVTLGLDATKFQAGSAETQKSLKTTTDAAKRAGKEMEASGKQAAQYFSQIKNEALGLIGVLLGGKGIENFVRDTTVSLAALGREARNIGIAVPELAAFRNMIERNGGSAEAAQQSFRNLTDEMERFKVFGQSSLIQFLNPIGAQRGDSAMEVYMKFVRFAEAHKGDVPLVNLIGKGLGFDQGSINEALKGIAQVKKDLAESYALGVPSKEMTERYAQLQHDWTALTQAASNLGTVMLDKLQPSLSRFLGWQTDVIKNDRATGAALLTIEAGLISIGAVKITGGLAWLLGMGNMSAGLGWIGSLLTRLATITLPLALSGDTPTDPAMNKPYDPVTNPNLFDRNGTVGKWWEQHAPSWLGGGGGGAVHSMDHSEFIKKYMPYAIQAGKETGVDPRIIIAQAALESNWGASAPGNNLFGIKGAGQNATTREFVNGQWITTTASFRSYASPEQSFKGYADFINNNPRYARLKAAGDLDSQLRELQQSGYATAPNYSSAVGGIVRQLPPGGVDPSLNLSPRDRIPGINASKAGVQNSSETHIGTVNIHTQATDAQGIAKDFHRAVQDNTITQSNRGLQ